MIHIKTFEGFHIATEEELFGKQTNLEQQFSDMMVNNLSSDNEEISLKWSTYNAFKIALDDINLVNELKYRITDGENPKKVFLSIFDKIEKPSKELIRLKNKIDDFNF